MPPKRKASSASTPSKKKKEEKQAAPAPAPAASASKKTKEEAPAKSPSKVKGIGNKTVSEVWSSSEYVSDGKMTQEGFATFIDHLGIEEMSFEAFFLSYRLAPNETVEDAMLVCTSKHAMQSALESFGSRNFAELPAKLRAKCTAVQGDFGLAFAPFFRWLFEMGKAISALNNEVSVDRVRTVPLEVGLPLMGTALAKWPLMETLKAFCVDKFGQPFTKDLWTQIGRLAHLTRTAQIARDLSNYDDDGTGGGSAWPCAIDDFVEYVQAQGGSTT